MRDYEHKFAIAYNRSTDKLRVSFPNAVKFPHTCAWVWLQDVSTVVISPSKPKSVRGSQFVPLSVYTNRKCRIAQMGPVTHGIGKHFRNVEVSFRHEDGRFFLKIPDECDRLPPKNRNQYKISPKLDKAIEIDKPVQIEDNHLVLIERGDQELSFSVPDGVLKDIIGEWVLDGYLVRD